MITKVYRFWDQAFGMDLEKEQGRFLLESIKDFRSLSRRGALSIYIESMGGCQTIVITDGELKC